MIGEENLQFSLPPDHEKEQQRAREAIARLCDLPPGEIDAQELRLYSSLAFLTVEQLRALRPEVLDEGVRLEQKYPGNSGVELTRAEIERTAELAVYTEELAGDSRKGLTYGILLPSYTQVLENYRSQGHSGSHRSLLVGALAPSSVIEYAACVRQIFPTAECFVVDIAGSRTPQTAKDRNMQFLYADGFHLPFGSVFDSIQTNCLLGDIERENNSRSRESRLDLRKVRGSFFQESFCALKPGGLVILAEPSGGMDLQRNIAAELTQNGFGQISFSISRLFRERADLVRHLRGTADTVQERYLKDEPAYWIITAEKPQ